MRRVYMELKNRGYDVNHKRVQRLMHDAGLLGKRSKEKYHSYKGEVGHFCGTWCQGSGIIENRSFNLVEFYVKIGKKNRNFMKC